MVVLGSDGLWVYGCVELSWVVLRMMGSDGSDEE